MVEFLITLVIALSFVSCVLHMVTCVVKTIEGELSYLLTVSGMLSVAFLAVALAALAEYSA